MKKMLSQESLKLIACLTMLIDHIGAVIYPSIYLRMVGRMSFPIFCFLLSEGIYRTKNERAYLLRLFLFALLSEFAFDFCFGGGWGAQSVMLTLLLGALMGMLLRRCSSWAGKLLLIAVFAVLAHLLQTDYGHRGILIIALFLLTHEMPRKLLFQAAGLIAVSLLFSANSIQLLSVFAMLPIGLYSGRKYGHNRLIQWGFYAFYPLHLLMLAIIRMLLW